MPSPDLPNLRLVIFVTCSLAVAASAFELSSLWGSWFGDGECANDYVGDDEYDEILAFPRRDLVEMYGEEGYHRRLMDALGESSSSTASISALGKSSYGVDVSFPIHTDSVSTNYDWLPHNAQPEEHTIAPEFLGQPVQPLGNKQQEYDTYINGCKEYYDKKSRSCVESERDRTNMNLRQPKSMQNYTDIGFKKIKASKQIMKLLTEFWGTNKDRQVVEKWSTGNTYTNHWSSPSYMLSVENPSLQGGGSHLKQRIWDMARNTMEQWTGEELSPSSLYGIRIYKDGAVLAPHVDRLPLVTSAIINVAQDVDEPWPLEVYAHDGKAYNITMDPGDMVLYESHSVVHGRPFPLKGRFYANVFIHFEPVGHSLRHEARMSRGPATTDEELFERAAVAAAGGVVGGFAGGNTADLPPYILKGTTEELRWRQKHKKKEETSEKSKAQKPLSASMDGEVTIAHKAAGDGDLDIIRSLAASDDTSMFHVKDSNGWEPLHEAARGGNVEIVEILLEHNVDINARPNNGKGGTPLWWSDTSHGENSPVSKLLRKRGAKKIAPTVG